MIIKKGTVKNCGLFLHNYNVIFSVYSDLYFKKNLLKNVDKETFL